MDIYISDSSFKFREGMNVRISVVSVEDSAKNFLLIPGSVRTVEYAGKAGKIHLTDLDIMTDPTMKSANAVLLSAAGIILPGIYRAKLSITGQDNAALYTAENIWSVEEQVETHSILYDIIEQSKKKNTAEQPAVQLNEKLLLGELRRLHPRLEAAVSDEGEYYEVVITWGEPQLLLRKTTISKTRKTTAWDTSVPDLNTYHPPHQLVSGMIRNNPSPRRRSIEGDIRLSHIYSSDTDSFSDISRHVSEVYGQVDLPLMGVPVSITGFYTTMDKNRPVKSGYLRVSLNKEKIRQQLLDNKDKYLKNAQSALSAYKNHSFTHSSYNSHLTAQQDSLFRMLSVPGMLEPGALEHLSDGQVSNEIRQAVITYSEAYLRKKYPNLSADSLQKEIESQSDMILKAAGKYAELKKKSEDMYRMAEQYAARIRLDSLAAHRALNPVKNEGGLSSRQLYDQYKDVLPSDRITPLLSSISHFDLGIINSQVSKYTMDGQTMKGASAGFDFKSLYTRLTYGQVEFIDRNHNIEEYYTLNSQIGIRVSDDADVSFVFQNVTGTPGLMTSFNFQNAGKELLKSISGTNRLYALNSSGKLNRYLTWDVDYTLSQSPDMDTASRPPFQDRSALNAAFTGALPGKDIFLSLSYERVGRNFENNTLSFVMNGIEKVAAHAESYLLNSRLYVKVEYNHLLQKNLYAQGVQNKFGFDLKTQFRNLPNLSISYKPFTSVRSPYDTFNIAQRQVLGSVMLLNMNYLYKTKTSLFRVILMHNSSSSLADEIKMSARTSQLMMMYSYQERIMSHLSLGIFSNSSDEEYRHRHEAYNSHSFINSSVSYRLNPSLSLSGGADATFKNIVLRAGGHLGVSYDFKKIPVSVRLNNRVYGYRLSEQARLKTIYMATIDLSYRFLYDIN